MVLTQSPNVGIQASTRSGDALSIEFKMTVESEDQESTMVLTGVSLKLSRWGQSTELPCAKFDPIGETVGALEDGIQIRSLGKIGGSFLFKHAPGSVEADLTQRYRTTLTFDFRGRRRRKINLSIDWACVLINPHVPTPPSPESDRIREGAAPTENTLATLSEYQESARPVDEAAAATAVVEQERASDDAARLTRLILNARSDWQPLGLVSSDQPGLPGSIVVIEVLNRTPAGSVGIDYKRLRAWIISRDAQETVLQETQGAWAR